MGASAPAGLALAALLGGACGPERIILPPPPDTSAPAVHVLSPTPAAYDLDGDAFVDISVTWADSGGRVGFAHATLRSLDGLTPPAPDTADLLRHWRIERLDSTGLIAHETVDHLLRRGVSRLLLEVPDTAGNVRRDTLVVQLPNYLTLSRTIPTGGSLWLPAEHLVICEDGLLYVTVGNQVAVIDPDSLSLLETVQPGSTIETSPSDRLHQPVCVPGDPILYISDHRLMRLDRSTRRWVPRIGASWSSVALALSRRDPDVLYEGESIDALVGIINRRLGRRTGSLLETAPWNTNINAIVPAPGDNPLYVAYGEFGGVWAVDPLRDSVLVRFNLADPGDSSYLGGAMDMVPNLDGTKVYVAVTDGSPRGVAEIDVATNRITRRLGLVLSVPISLAVSPDGRYLFVTTQDQWLNTPSTNVLIDLAAWQPLEFVPRPRPPGQVIRYDRGVVFHPDGRRIFVTHDKNVDVYLMRQ